MGKAEQQQHTHTKHTRMATMATTMYQVTVPAGVGPGDTFGVEVAGQQMLVTVPAGVTAGSQMQIQVAAPPSDVPTVAGVPVAAGMAAGDVPAAATKPRQRLHVHGVEYVETEEVSCAGWACLIFGIFLFPLNLLGLCMTEKRVVAVPVTYR